MRCKSHKKLPSNFVANNSLIRILFLRVVTVQPSCHQDLTPAHSGTSGNVLAATLSPGLDTFKDFRVLFHYPCICHSADKRMLIRQWRKSLTQTLILMMHLSIKQVLLYQFHQKIHMTLWNQAAEYLLLQMKSRITVSLYFPVAVGKQIFILKLPNTKINWFKSLRPILYQWKSLEYCLIVTCSSFLQLVSLKNSYFLERIQSIIIAYIAIQLYTLILKSHANNLHK